MPTHVEISGLAITRLKAGVYNGYRSIPLMRYVLLAIVAASSCQSARAQTLASGGQSYPTQYIATNWQTEQGLPQNSINAMAQDQEGYLWLATNGGLVRFDGVRLKVLGVSDIPSLRTPRILSVYVDRGGALWMGTQVDGLLRRKDGVLSVYAAPGALAGSPVTSIREDAAGNLWVNTVRGAGRFTGGKLQPYPSHQGRAVREFLLQARDGSMWFRSGPDVARFGADGSIATVPGGWLAHEARDGSVWVGSFGENRVWRYRDGVFSDVPLPRVERPLWAGAFPKQGVVGMATDRDGELLLITTGGLARAVDGTLSSLETLPQPTASGDLPKVLSFLVDREGNYWVGTRAEGLFRFRRAPLTAYGKNEGLSDSPFRAVFQERDGRIWLAADDSLYWFDGQFHLVPDMPDIRTIAQTQNGDVWFGGSGGLYRRRSGLFTRYKIDFPAVIDILEDRHGTLWVVMQSYDRPGGLFQFRDGNFERMPGFQGAFYIVEDRDGGLWVSGTRGLSSVRGGKTVLYDQTQGLPRSLVSRAYQDSNGTVWVPTGGGGLCRFRDGRFRVITTRDGLPTDHLFGLLEDSQGYLWAGSNQGIYRFSLKELNDVADGRTSSIAKLGYAVADGMRTSECNGAAQGSWKTRDGRLWFSSMRGVVAVDPMAGSRLPPPVVLEEAWANRLALERGGGSSVPARNTTFDFQFTALSLYMPERAQFKYRLEPFDKEWVDAGTRRTAHYTNMAPGEYSFRVIAANSYGVWNEHGAGVRFVLRPHFYQTSWFYALSAAPVLALMWAAYQLRVRQLQRAFNIRLEERLHERERIARELHDTLLQSFHGLLYRFQAARNLFSRRPEEALNTLDSAISSAEDAIAEGRDAIRNLRQDPIHDRLEDLLTSAGQELRDQCESPPAPVFQVTVEGRTQALRPLLQDEIYRIAREVLRNAFHHACAHRIEAALQYDPALFRLRIRDDGKGIEPKVLQAGARPGHWGLPGMRERAKRIGARLALWSESGVGTEIELTVRASIAYAAFDARRGFGLLRKIRAATAGGDGGKI